MDAIEDLARLDDPPGGAVAQSDERILAGAIDAGEPQDMQVLAGAGGEGLPSLLGGEPFAAALIDRARLRRLVDPAAGMVAVDPDRREIDDALELRRPRDRLREMAQHRIAGRIGRDRHEQAFGGGEPIGDRRIGGLPIEDESSDAFAAQRLRPFPRVVTVPAASRAPCRTRWSAE